MYSGDTVVDCSIIYGRCRIYISVEYLFKDIIIASHQGDFENFSSLNIHLDDYVATSRREEAMVSL